MLGTIFLENLSGMILENLHYHSYYSCNGLKIGCRTTSSTNVLLLVQQPLDWCWDHFYC